MKCDTCINQKNHSGGSFVAVSEGEDDPYSYNYCSKGYWMGNDHEKSKEKDPWEDCEDYQKVIVSTRLFIKCEEIKQ